MTHLPTNKKPPKLSPAALVASPIRSLPVPNASGDLAVYTQHFPVAGQTPTPQHSIWVLDLKNPRSWPIPDTRFARFPQWLGHSDRIIWLEGRANGHTQFVVADARLRGERYIAGEISGPVWDLRTTSVVNMGHDGDEVKDNDLGFAVVGEVDEDGGLFNPFRRGSSLSSGCEGQSLETTVVLSMISSRHGHESCRHGDGQRRTVIWFGSLVRPTGSLIGRYTIPSLTNLMAYFDLGDVSLQSPPGKKNHEICRDFSISSWAIVFVAKDPELDGATHTACSCYICPMADWSGLIIPDDYYKAFRHRGLGGACSSPAISSRGSIAFLSQKQDGYAADKNRVILVEDSQNGRYKEIFGTADGKGQWELSPSRVTFAADGKLLLNVEERGRAVIYQLARSDGATLADLKRIEPIGSVAKSVVDATPLNEKPSMLLVTSESFTYGQKLILHDLLVGSIRVFPLDSPRFGLSDSQIDEIWFPSANDRKIHVWVLRPSFFNPEHKYPLVYLIHDTQHGSWSSSWNSSTTGLNLALFAEHGYVVVAPNVTGSIGYGEDFVNATRHSYAEAPYQDLENGFNYLEKEVPYIDTSRSVALGCGYGGYMVNWIQGRDLGRRFATLVSCNGILNIMSHLATDVQHTVVHELGGPPWVSADEWRRSDPAQFLHKWSTPQLVIHDAAGAQCPVSDAVAAIKTLRLRGVECELLQLPADAGDMGEPGNRVLFYQTILDWISRYTG